MVFSYQNRGQTGSRLLYSTKGPKPEQRDGPHPSLMDHVVVQHLLFRLCLCEGDLLNVLRLVWVATQKDKDAGAFQMKLRPLSLQPRAGNKAWASARVEECTQTHLQVGQLSLESGF